MNGTGLSYFDELYAASDDPWAMQRRWYERRKRDLVMASLPRERYAHAFEPGCGAGHLTALLAPRCERLLASDFAPDAVRLARARLQGAPHVGGRMPASWSRSMPAAMAPGSSPPATR